MDSFAAWIKLYDELVKLREEVSKLNTNLETYKNRPNIAVFTDNQINALLDLIVRISEDRKEKELIN